MKHFLTSKYHLSAECFLSFDFSQAFVDLQKEEVLHFYSFVRIYGKLNAKCEICLHKTK